MTQPSNHRNEFFVEDVNTFVLTGTVTHSGDGEIIVETGSEGNENLIALVALADGLETPAAGARIYIQGEIYSGSLVASEMVVFSAPQEDGE